MPKRKTGKRDQPGPRQHTDRTRTAERFHPDPEEGLSAQQVEKRIREGLHNGDSGMKTKTEGQIIRENVFTFFNLLNFALAAAVILVGSPRNALFLGVILSNIVIGSFQGIRAKHTIDKLSLISSPKARVVRDGRQKNIQVEELVLDDIMLLSAGNQICSDAVVTGGECEVNESLITGESDPVLKQPGDSLLSGSFIVSGGCSAQVEHVGADNYASRIAGDAKYIKKRNSEIMDSIDIIVKMIGFAIVPIGALLFWKQYFVLGDTVQNAVVSTTAAVVGMIPEGLVLLISLAFAVSVLKLSSRKTLVQDMYCIETLARVDTLCLDKTGTITEGTMQVDSLLPFEGISEEDMAAALTALVCNLSDENPTFLALKDRFSQQSPWHATELVPFSSARKWSGAFFPGKGTYVMGAGEFILGEDFSAIQEQVEEYSQKGQRVLLLAHSQEGFSGKELPEIIEPMGLVLISDKIRREAARTLRYFADQGVDLKVISGDNAVTVANIARKAGLENADRFVDATTLETEEDIRDAVNRYCVFGRVTPQQKLAFVKALKADGHTVAMTGDGVNDVLALKDADCGIAMASGSDAACHAAQLVLLDSNFACLPQVVAEGRRVINNIQRSAALYLVKNIFSFFLALLTIVVDMPYPLVPIQLSLISALTIGIPSFFLALEPNKSRVRGRFMSNVLREALPGGLTDLIIVLGLQVFAYAFAFPTASLSTLSALCVAFIGLLVLFHVCRPFDWKRRLLWGSMTGAMVLCVTVEELKTLFSLTRLNLQETLILTVFLIMSFTLMRGVLAFFQKGRRLWKRLKKEERRGQTPEEAMSNEK